MTEMGLEVYAQDGAPATRHDAVLLSLASQIKIQHALAGQNFRATVGHMLQCGHFLAQARQMVGHGRWLEWLKANCAISERTARRYIEMYEGLQNITLPESVTLADLTARELLKLVSAQAGDDSRRQKPRSRKGEVQLTRVERLKGIDRRVWEFIPEDEDDRPFDELGREYGAALMAEQNVEERERLFTAAESFRDFFGGVAAAAG